MKYFLTYLIISILLSIIKSEELEPLTPTELLSTFQISDFILSPNGEYLIMSIKKYDSEAEQTYIHLQYKNLETNETKNLTSITFGQSDLYPQFSPSFPNILFFLRTTNESSSIYYMIFPPEEEITNDEDKSIQLTNYTLPVNDYKIKGKTIIFSTEVYFQCKTMNCSADLIEKEKNKGYQTYDKLFMFHWDKWLIEGKGSHLFIQKFDYDKSDQKIILLDEPKDITYSMEINAPPLFTDFSNYDISNDGTKVAFAAYWRNNNEAFDTGYKIYYYDLDLMKYPICITNHTQARNQKPVFSKDSTTIAYLAMQTPGMEREVPHFEIYNILTGTTFILPNVEELFIQSFNWYTNYQIIFSATSFQVDKLFILDIKNITKPIVVSYDVKYEDLSYTLPKFAMKNKDIGVSKIDGYDTPEHLMLINYTDQIDFPNYNEDLFKNKFISKAEQFSFQGGNKNEVFGFFFRPINFDPDLSYPLALLIHGGPEGSWTNSWRESWNPQLFTGMGYAVVMINPHGSIGFGKQFEEDVRNNWGGVPFEDIILGVNTILDQYSFLNKTRICAAGASYGGFIINWIEGHNYENETIKKDWIFNCLVNHDGVFNHISMFYSTDEIFFPRKEFCDINYGDCNPWEGKKVREWFETYSPEKYVENWNTPMLIIHGGKDYRVPLTEGLSAFTALQMKGIPSEFLYFHEESHRVLKPSNLIKWYEEVLKFFDKYTESNEFEIPKEAKIYKLFNKNYNY